MYAVIGRWQMDPGRQEDQLAGLNEQILPMVKQAPGFVRGSWSMTTDGTQSVSYIEFDSKSAAERFVAIVEADPEDRRQHGVAEDWLAVTEIIAIA